MSKPLDPNKKNRPDSERRKKQAGRVVRVLYLYKMLHSPWTVKAVADTLGCSERTVFRDLHVLRIAGLVDDLWNPQPFIEERQPVTAA